MTSGRRVIRGIMIAAAALFAVAVIWFFIYFIIPRLPTGDVNLPVLMYHHIAEESMGGTVVSVSRFEEQIKALKDAGYESVTLKQVTDYVEKGTELPKKPVLITFDDGYTSNLYTAAPILEKYSMCATVFVIGVNEGREIYVHSGNKLYPPRFSYEDALPWVEKGVLDLQSHSYDMHQLESYGFSGRDGMLKLPGESDDDYRRAVIEDTSVFADKREGRVPTELTALAYPFGFYTEELDEILHECGIKMTFTVNERINPLKTGDEDCLWAMGRFNITEKLSGKLLLLWIW